MYYVYILGSPNNKVLYVGFTTDLLRRVYEHKQGRVLGFTKKYHVTKLLYFEAGEGYDGVLSREKQIKKYSRFKKEQLILSLNPSKKELYYELE